MRPVLPLLVLAALAVTPAAAPAAATSSQKTIARLKRENRTLHRDVRRLQSNVTRTTDTLTDVRQQLLDLKPISDENTRLRTENDNLRAGLPNAINAVGYGDLFRLVFAPLRARTDICDSYYVDGSYWSLTFDSRGLC